MFFILNIVWFAIYTLYHIFNMHYGEKIIRQKPSKKERWSNCALINFCYVSLSIFYSYSARLQVNIDKHFAKPSKTKPNVCFIPSYICTHASCSYMFKIKLFWKESFPLYQCCRRKAKFLPKRSIIILSK